MIRQRARRFYSKPFSWRGAGSRTHGMPGIGSARHRLGRSSIDNSFQLRRCRRDALQYLHRLLRRGAGRPAGRAPPIGRRDSLNTGPSVRRVKRAADGRSGDGGGSGSGGGKKEQQPRPSRCAEETHYSIIKVGRNAGPRPVCKQVRTLASVFIRRARSVQRRLTIRSVTEPTRIWIYMK